MWTLWMGYFLSIIIFICFLFYSQCPIILIPNHAHNIWQTIWESYFLLQTIKGPPTGPKTRSVGECSPNELSDRSYFIFVLYFSQCPIILIPNNAHNICQTIWESYFLLQTIKGPPTGPKTRSVGECSPNELSDRSGPIDVLILFRRFHLKPSI